MPDVSPAHTAPVTAFAYRRRIATTLRRLRDGRGFKQKEVAAALEWSVSKVIRIENATTRVGKTDAEALLGHYGAGPDLRAAVVEWVRLSRAREWWDMLPAQVPDNVRTLLAWEGSAAAVVEVQARHVPVLLQTPEYHAALRPMGIGEPHDHGLAEQILDQRQRLLRKSKPPHLRFLLDEAVLWRSPGNPTTLLGQLDRLLEFARLDHVEIGVMPLAAARTGPWVSAFSLMCLPADDAPGMFAEGGREEGGREYDDNEQQFALWVTIDDSVHIRTEPSDRQRAAVVLKHAEQIALHHAASIDFIRDVRHRIAVERTA